jgi:hypothetical protein
LVKGVEYVPIPPDVVAVRVLRDRVLVLTWEDGVTRAVDVGGLLYGPVFLDVAEFDAAFAQVRVDPEIGTISWPNGADIAPETLRALPAFMR